MAEFAKAVTTQRQRKNQAASGGALVGAGGVTAGTGLVAGGIPGARSKFVDFKGMKNKSAASASESPAKATTMRTKVADKTSTAKQRASTVKAAPGGIMGWRVAAHQNANAKFKRQTAAAGHARRMNNENVARHFAHGLSHGRIGPEDSVIQELKSGRKAAGAAVVGGSAAVGYGLHRIKDSRKKPVSKSERHTEAYNGGLVAGGLTTAAVGHQAGKVLDSKSKYWMKRAKTTGGLADKLAPHLKGTSNEDAMKNPHNFKDAKTAENVGRFRSAAGQASYFSNAYKSNAKMVRAARTPGVAVAAVGAGGLGLSRKKEKKQGPVKKSLSAFGVDHG